ncbi:MAG: tetratricopeptide repeat protein [Anaerolineaceae bacterium]|nr:tetratricopeptide repeat protein [Anaerolineaceae bacterium]
MSNQDNSTNKIVSNLIHRIQTTGYTATATIGYSIIILSTLAELSTTTGSSGMLPAVIGLFAGGFWDTVGGPLLEMLWKGNEDGENDDQKFVRLFKEFERQVKTLDQASFERLKQLSKQLENHTKVIGTCLELNKNEINQTIRISTDRILAEIRESKYQQPEEISIARANEDELLVLVATFRGQQTNDAAIVLSEQIKQILSKAGIKRVRVESLSHILGDEEDGVALALLVKFNASLVIWGRDTTSGVVISHLRRVHVDGLFVTQQELLNPNAPEFFIEMNQNMPSFLACGALVTVSDTLSANRRYKDVIKLITTIDQILQKSSPLSDSARMVLRFAYSNMGYAHWAIGQYHKAVEAYSLAIEVDNALGTQVALPYMNRAVNHGHLGNYRLAQSDFSIAERLIDTISDSAASLYFNIAVSYSERGDTEKAIDYYIKADKVKNGIYIDAIHNLGILFLKMGKLDEAIKHFTRVIEASPNHPYAYLNRASAHIELGQYDEAITDCTVTIDHGTNEHPAYLNRSKARLYLYLKQLRDIDIADIESDLDAAIQRQKIMTPDEIFWYGLSFRGIGRVEQACEYFTMYVRTAPNGEKKEQARQAIREMKCK